MKNIKFAFEDLNIYQQMPTHVGIAYDFSSIFPKQKKYGLTSQLNRAAVYIALNIAEGFVDTDTLFNRFLQITIDSIKECGFYATNTKHRSYITASDDYSIRI